MARKLALVIGNSQYEDPGLSRLAAPDVDVRALVDILQSPGIGGFDEVTPLLNEGLANVRKSIARFFDARHRDDLLVLYFSGHGVRDEQGHLYLAVRDTERAVLAGTAIEASYVTTRMDRSASKRLVLVLDCCHSGAFGVGTKSAQASSVGTAAAFEGTGRGRVVLTATDSTQYAWEGDQVIGDVENSLFTHYLIEGLKSGDADRDGDGQITIDEIYDYVYEHVLNDTPKQTPGKWAFGQQGEIVIANNPSATKVRLPPEIEDALNSKLPSVRLEAVRELEGILRGRAGARAQAALELLRKLTEDDSRRVVTAADEALKGYEADRARVEAEQKREAQRELESQLREEVKRQQEIAEQARREHAERERAIADIAAACAAAAAALDRGALEEVPGFIERVLVLAPDHPGALSLRETLQERIEERARLEEAERRIRELRQRIGNLIARANATVDDTGAIALLGEALGLDPEHAEVKDLLGARYRRRAEAEDAERRTRSIEAMKVRIARHLERNELEEAGRTLVDAKALEAPEGTFAALQQQLDTIVEQRRKEAEDAARKRAAAERRAREEQLECHIGAARTAVAARRFDDAEAALTNATAIDPAAPAIATLRERVRDGRAELEAAERKRREIDGHLTQASRHLENGNLTKAILLTDVVLRLDAGDEGAQQLHAKIQQAIKEQQEAEERAARERERQRQIQDMLSGAEAAPTHDAAIKILNDLLALDSGNTQARRLLKTRQANLERDQAEQRRQEARTARAEADRVALQEQSAVQEGQPADREEKPSTTFSALRTVSAPTRWSVMTVLRSTSFRLVLGLVLAAGVGVSVLMPRTPNQSVSVNAPAGGASTTATSTPPQPAPTESAPPVSTPPVSTPSVSAAGTVKTPDAVVTPTPPARSEATAAAERLAARQLRAGNGLDALKTIVSALATDPDDEGLRRILSAIAVDARKRADLAERDAVNTGSYATASKAFGEGKQLSADGDRLRGTQQHELAARRYWTATDRFEEAARTPPPPAPVATALPGRPQEPPANANTAPSTANASPSATPSTEKPKPYTAPVVPKPAPAAPESPAWSESAARAAVERLLDQYEAALEQLNVDAFKVLWPSMARETEQNLRAHLGGYRSVQVSISNCSYEFTQNGSAATAICRERNQIKFRVGNNIDARYETRFTLRALGQSWVIVGWSRTGLSR